MCKFGFHSCKTTSPSVQLLYLFLCFSIVSCYTPVKHNDTQVENTAKESWETLNQPEYSVQYPSLWELDLNKKQNGGFELLSPAKDSFRANISLVIENLSSNNIRQKKYFELPDERIKRPTPRYTIIENEMIKRGTVKYQKMVYADEGYTCHVKFEKYCIISNDKAFVLTFGCLKDKFSAFQKTGERVLNSFAIH